jgi:hypothetical protein
MAAGGFSDQREVFSWLVIMGAETFRGMAGALFLKPLVSHFMAPQLAIFTSSAFRIVSRKRPS